MDFNRKEIDEFLEPYKDEYGLLIQSDDDPGDSAMETCFWILCDYWLERASLNETKKRYQNFKKHCLESNFPWRIRRHPDPHYWSRDWNRGTADQWQNFIILASTLKDYSLLLKLLLSFSLRLFFCTNTRRRNVYETEKEHKQKAPRFREWNFGWIIPDPRPEFIFHFIRGFYPFSFFLWPILWASDITVVVDAIIKSTFFWNKKIKAGNDGNYVMQLLFMKHQMPTPTAKLARWLYKTFRLKVYVDVPTNLNKIQQALHMQYSPSTRNPPLHLVAHDLIGHDFV